ncbi:hypothetical protein [Lutibacter sp.]|uniref:hypothetical protein n=1 Tax=Lutibacter sp. TaxID=1925666 RepID=UPI0035623863
MIKILDFYTLILFVFINNLFLYKYGSRLDIINIYGLIFGYNLFLFSIFYSVIKIKLSNTAINLIFGSIVFLFFCVTVYVNISVDGENLNVDRWSAMSNSIKALLNNEYPYTAQTHLGKGSSNLPSIFFIGFPFYVLGNVGFLQSFSFLLYSFILFKTLKNPKAKLVGILLLTLSIFYWWEIYAKSDLMTNFIIILGFILYSEMKKIDFTKPYLLGLISGFLLYTRLVAIIPLSILLFKNFINVSLKTKVKFISTGLIIILILSFLIFRNCPNIETFINYNPFNLQKKSSQFPIYLSFILILFPLYFSLKIKKSKQIIDFSVLLLSLTVLLSFSMVFYTYGFSKIINNHLFDISYFNLITPFIIYKIAFLVDNSKFIYSKK